MNYFGGRELNEKAKRVSEVLRIPSCATQHGVNACRCHPHPRPIIHCEGQCGGMQPHRFIGKHTVSDRMRLSYGSEILFQCVNCGASRRYGFDA